MGPAILARALGGVVPYAVKIHGSALEYTVKPHPRFRPFAAEGLAGARGILVGSRHTAESLWAEMDDPTVPRPHPPRPAGRRRRALRAARAGGGARGPRRAARAASPHAAARATRLAADAARRASPADAAPPASSFARDVREAVAALDTVEPGDRLVVFVGKLIASKGVELLLAAFPLVLAREPRARLLIVGFGAFRAGLEELAAALAAGDLDAARRDARARTGASCRELAAFLSASRTRTPTAPPRGLATAWPSPGRSTTPSWPTCSPPPRRWRSPARSRRRSAWSPPRPPPAARCRSSPTTPGWARSRARSSAAVPEAGAPLALLRGRPRRRHPARRRPLRLARGARGPPRRHPRGDRRGHPRPLLLGRRRPHDDRRRPGRAHRPPAP